MSLVPVHASRWIASENETVSTVTSRPESEKKPIPAGSSRSSVSSSHRDFPRESSSCGEATPQRAEGIEPPGDGAGKAGFSFAIRRNRAKDWWLRLVGSVGSANALNGFVGAPSKFEKKVDTGLLVAVIQASVIAAACSSGI